MKRGAAYELLALLCTLPVIAALIAWRWPTWPVTRWQASLGEDLAGLAVLALGGFVTIALVGLVFAVASWRRRR
jgi:hypothetical protein